MTVFIHTFYTLVETILRIIVHKMYFKVHMLFMSPAGLFKTFHQNINEVIVQDENAQHHRKFA